MSDVVALSSLQPLRIAVIGMGGIGSTFALQLARVGQHEVTAIARPGSLRLQQLLRDRGVINTAGEHAVLHVAEQLDEAAAYDLVLVTLLDHQVDAVLPALTRCVAKWIQFMFNTFDPERLRDAVGADRCSFGMPFIQGSIDLAGRLNAKIGAGGQKTRINNRIGKGFLERPACHPCLNRTCFSGCDAMFPCVSRLRVYRLPLCDVEVAPHGASRW